MKKIIFFAGLLFCSLANAQLVSVKNGTADIADGEVITFDHLHSNNDPAEIRIKITNISDTEINLKLRIEAMENVGDDLIDHVQFCFGDCYFDINVGTTVPFAQGGLALAPDESNANGDHFFSNYPGEDPNAPVSFTIGVIQVDAEGTQIGDVLHTFTYKYEPNLGIDDFTTLQNMGININNTVVKNTFDLNTTANTTLEVYAINGQLIKTVNLKTGAQSVDLSALNSGIYITRFTTEDKRTSQVRIVKN